MGPRSRRFAAARSSNVRDPNASHNRRHSAPGPGISSHGKRVRRTIATDAIQEVYASLVINKVGRRGKAAERRPVQYGEINLFLKNGKFEPVLFQRQTDDTIPVTDDPLNEEAVVPLTKYNARTQLQSSALIIADTLNLSAEYDKRLK